MPRALLAALLAFAAVALAPAGVSAQRNADETVETCIEARIYLLVHHEDSGLPLVGEGSEPIWRSCYETRRAPPPRRRTHAQTLH
jgi:hypothetical protein